MGSRLLNKQVFLVFLATLTVACQPVELGEFSVAEVCKAGIATFMGKDPGIIVSDGSFGEVEYLYYYRKSDGTRWDFRCKLKSDRIVWATETGPWRTRNGDPKVEFAIQGNRIAVAEIFSDGSHRSKVFSRSQL
ncbi:hypothetical protein [Marinobacter sp. MDS2]|uniref:hypothetical protein n=1 Tax=Marinobacter sp. MDS2 TaxID=3065961 RepID=UPI00273B7537|nr:hypothetical protein [Marinobacter sp. MDS2]MDP4548713.1 hypothetical protein [Marinobacter sp. MDS2]